MKKYIVIILSVLPVLFLYFYTSHKNTYVEGEVFYCNKKPVLDKNIFIGIFKDFESIKNFKPLKYSILKSNNHYKIKTNALNVNNFFLVVFTTTYDSLIPPSKDSIVNDWTTSIYANDYYKNISLCDLNENLINKTSKLLNNKKTIETNLDIDSNKVEKDKEEANEIVNEDKELYNYKINASLDAVFFTKACSENDSLVAIVEVYDSKINKFFPTKKNMYSLKTKNPLDSILLYCNEFNFEFNFSSYAEEIYPYITARVLDQKTKKIIYYGVAEDINGVPISLLSRRKENLAYTIKLKKNENPDFGDLIINVEKEALIAEIKDLALVKLKTNLNQAYLSNEDGQILIKDLPLNSLIPISIIDPGSGAILNFEIFMEFPIQNIKIPPLKFAKTSLTVIHNKEFSSISSLSNEPKNKINFSLTGNFEQVLNLEENVTNYFTFSDNNYRTALADISLENNLIIEPSNIFLNEIKGTVFEQAISGSNKPCENCNIELLYSSETSKTVSNGSFYIELKNIFIEPSVYFYINDNFLVNTLVPKNLSTLKMDVLIPDKDLIRYFNSISPTRKNNSIVFGKGKGRVFLNNNTVFKEAKYISDKNIYFIPDLEFGKYTLFVVENNFVTHIRTIKILNSGSVIIIN